MKLTALLAVAALGVVAACGGSSGYMTSSTNGGGGGGGGGSSSLNLVMSGTAFSPALDSVAVGSTVTWTNQDGFAHTVTYASGPDAGFDSGNIGSAGTFQHTFMTAGTIVYYCRIHGTPTSGMRGTIVVH
jgi:plastocyanin